MSIHLQRAWRVRAGLAILAGVAAFVLPIGYLRTALLLDATYRLPVEPDLVFAGLLACALATIAVWQAFAAQREHRRARQRAAVLSSNASAMPRARRTYDWFDDEAQPGVPVVVEWRARRVGSFILDLCKLLVFGLGAIVTLVVWAYLITTFSTRNIAGLAAFTCAGVCSTHASASSLQMLLVLLLGFGVMMWVRLRDQWRNFARRFTHLTLEASDVGLRWTGSRSRERVILWADARIFEVTQVRFPVLSADSRTRSDIRRYSLYSTDAVITWDNDIEFLGREARQSLSHLLHAVRDHSGLALRTSDWALATGARKRALRQENLVLGAVVVFWMLYSVALLVLALVVPPTTSVPVNVLVSSSLAGTAGLAGWTLGYYLHTAFALWRRTKEELALRHGGRQRRMPFPSFTAVIAAQRADAENSKRYLWLYRIFVGIWMVTLAADALPVISAIWFHGMWPWSHTQLVPTGVATIVAYLLILHGFVGFIGLPVAIVVLLVIAVLRVKRLTAPAIRSDEYSDRGLV